MKCFYIGKFGKFHNTENYVSHALGGFGVEVIKRSHRLNPAEIMRQMLDSNPDFVLFSKAKVDRCDWILKYCKDRLKAKTLCWQFDIYWGYRGQRLMPKQFWADHLFTTDGGHQDDWERIGCNHHLLRQGIHQPDHIRFHHDPVWDVGFVGGLEGHPSRPRLIQWLKRKYGRDFKHFTQTRGLDLNKAIAKCKVIVGDSYPSDHYWSNRIYEMLGRGAFLLHPETVGLDSEFTDGEHYASYRRGDFAQLAQLIDHYLSQKESRERIQQQGFEKCGEYTYSARVGELLRVADLSPES